MIKPEPKREAGQRTLELPSWCVAMLRTRFESRSGPIDEVAPVFCAVKGGLRDPSNIQADLREAFDAAGLKDATSHTLRKSVATLRDEAGLSPRMGADQLGHADPGMTMRKYWGRKRRATGAAAVLEQLGQIQNV